LRTVLGNAGAELLDTTLSVPEVHVRLDDASFHEELQELVSAFGVLEPQAA